MVSTIRAAISGNVAEFSSLGELADHLAETGASEVALEWLGQGTALEFFRVVPPEMVEGEPVDVSEWLRAIGVALDGKRVEAGDTTTTYDCGEVFLDPRTDEVMIAWLGGACSTRAAVGMLRPYDHRHYRAVFGR